MGYIDGERPFFSNHAKTLMRCLLLSLRRLAAIASCFLKPVTMGLTPSPIAEVVLTKAGYTDPCFQARMNASGFAAATRLTELTLDDLAERERYCVSA